MTEMTTEKNGVETLDALAPAMAAAACRNCRFWKPAQGEMGTCHRMPPVALFMGMQEIPVPAANIHLPSGQRQMMAQPIINSAFPSIRSFGWCGEWRLAEQAKP